MKLIRCYVYSFGKLKNFTYEFDSELNTIKQENGWGKTTLATFIKAMFYGVNSSKRNVNENERMKYRPWEQAGLFGGYVEFEWGGKQFKLERYFGGKEAEDTVRLFDSLTGKEFSNTENLGERIFEIDQEGFLSTTYFAQKDFQVKSNTSLTAKFNSVCEVQDTKTYDKAIEKLEEKAKFYKIRGDKGAISDLKREINHVEAQIESAMASCNVISGLKQEIADIEKQANLLKTKSVELTIKMEKQTNAQIIAVKKSQYQSLCNQKSALISEAESADKILNGNMPSEHEINEFKECYNSILELNSSKKMAQENVNKIQEQIDCLKMSKTDKKSKILASSIFLSAFALIALIFTFINPTIALVGLIGFILSLIICVCVVFSNKKTADDTLVDLLNNYTNKQNECIELQKKYSQKLTEYLSRYALPIECTIESAFDVIKDNVYQKRNAQKRIMEIDEQLKAFNGLVEQFNDVENISLDTNDLRTQLALVQEEYATIMRVLADKKSRLKTHEESESLLNDLESKKAQMHAKLEQYNYDYKTVLKTIEYLQKADENLKVKYRAPLKESLNKYLKFIDKNNASVDIDIDLNVTVIEQSGQKSTEYYSKGYQNLFEICKRFALTDVLFAGEKPFIILDDPFYNLDDEKLKSAIELVKKLSKEYQIIYLVCHESRVAQ